MINITSSSSILSSSFFIPSSLYSSYIFITSLDMMETKMGDHRSKSGILPVKEQWVDLIKYFIWSSAS